MTFTDIVMPEGNEQELVKMAERLGIKSLLLLYEEDSPELKEILERLKAATKTALYTGIVAKDFNKAFSLRKKYDLVFGNASQQAAESRAFDVLFRQEGDDRKDFMHSRNSGLNHVVAKLCAEKGKLVAVDFSMMLANPYTQRITLGRIMQNIRLQRRYGFGMIIASFARKPWQMRNPKDLEAFLQAAEMDAGGAKHALNLLYNRFRQDQSGN